MLKELLSTDKILDYLATEVNISFYLILINLFLISFFH